MTNITLPYFKLPGLGKTTEYSQNQLKQQVIKTLFPVIDGDHACKIDTLMIATYFGRTTLILTNDIKSFIDLPPLSDPMDLLPVQVYHDMRSKCTQVLADAITNHGYKIASSPTFVPIQIRCNPENCREDHIDVDRSKNNQLLLAHAIINNVHIKIGNICLSKMSPTWHPPPEKPHWQGLCFEQSDRVIRTWIQTSDYNALLRLSDNLDHLIQQTKSDRQQKLSFIKKLQDENRYHGEAKKILNNQVTDMDEILTKYTKYHTFLNEENASPASTITLQCAITAQVDSPDHLKQLNAYYCRKLIDIGIRSINDLSMQNITLEIPAVEKLISQIIYAINKKLSSIADNSYWNSFKKNTFQQKTKWSRQTFADFCDGDTRIGESNQQELQLEWRNSFNSKLNWMINALQLVNKELGYTNNLYFTGNDNAIYENLYATIAETLQRADTVSYKHYLELNQTYQEYECIRDAIRSHKSIHLVKRIASNGQIYQGVMKPPTNRDHFSDPNECLKEVHIPIFYSFAKN